MSAQAGSLASALVAAQQAMPDGVKKDATNPHFNSKFMSLDSLIKATRPALNEAGLALVQFPTSSEMGFPVLRTILIHGASGEQLQADTPLVGKAETMQQLGSAITYARRYAWQAVLGIAAEEDDDGNTAAEAKPARKPRQPGAGKATPISEAQRSRLFAIAREHQIDNDRVREIVKAVTGDPDGSTKAIPVARYDEVVAAIQKTGDPAVDSAESEAYRKTRLRRRITVLCDKAETEAAGMLPRGQESWDAYSQQLAREKFGVESRADLSADQLAEHLNELQEQMVPF